ncbi:sporulation integral membrane protein YtvI [Brevibacillus sp. H7]|uniref:sporulation integral membrane protein YtvI n=1 Tax=Brevibacillus sp. H7 TaxID=3349138 RepID=UPI00380FC2F9
MNRENWVERLFQIVSVLLRVARFIWVCLLLYLAYRLFLFATPLLYPFFISLLIALMINRPVTYLSEKSKIPRWLSVTIALIALLAFSGGLVTLIVASTVIEIGELITRLPVFMAELASYLQRTISQDFLLGLYNQIELFYTQLDSNYQDKINDTVGKGITSITQAGQNLVLGFLEGIKNILISLPNLATVLVISLLGAFFISKDFYLWETRLRRVLPRGVNSRMDTILIDLRNALFGFVKAQLTLISLTAAIVIVGLLILRVEYAVTIGLITGLVDLLPYLGTGTVFIPWIIYSFFKGNYSLVIGLSILYGIVIIFRQIMEPKVVAENVGLDPLLTLVALFVGLQLFGFLGLIVGPVTLVIINALVKANVFEDVWKYIRGREA